jgi:uncharacterized caspase-like protein
MIFYKRVLLSLVFSGVLLTSAWTWAANDFIIRQGTGQNLTPSTNTKETTDKKDGVTNGQRWVMAVGICKFADTRIPQLTYCVADARSISDYFKTDGVPDKQIILLADESAKKDSIMSSLEHISENISPDDSLFFFYSSHGAGDNAGKTYFITFDTVGDDLATTALPMQELKNAVKEIKCRNIVMMIDTCHSGGAKSLGRQDEKAFDKLLRTADLETRIAILTSSRTHESSIESNRWGHGAFTYFMLEGFAGASDNFPRDGHVSVTELFDYVMVAVPRATDRAQHPSGKFSYNWPGKKDHAVKIGQVTDKGSGVSGTLTGSGWRGTGQDDKGRPKSSDESWRAVID